MSDVAELAAARGPAPRRSRLSRPGTATRSTSAPTRSGLPGQQREPGDAGGAQRPRRLAGFGQHLVDRAALRPCTLGGQACSRIGLGVEIDQERRLIRNGQSASQIDGRRGLPDAALLVHDRYASAPVSLVFHVKRPASMSVRRIIRNWRRQGNSPGTSMVTARPAPPTGRFTGANWTGRRLRRGRETGSPAGRRPLQSRPPASSRSGIGRPAGPAPGPPPAPSGRRRRRGPAAG